MVFDGGATRDGSGRPLQKLVWSQVGSTDVVLSAAIDKANNENSGMGGPRLMISGSKIADIAAGSYTLKLTATNFLGVSDSTQAVFAVVASGDTPVVTVLGGSQQTFQIAHSIMLSSQLLAASVCANKQVC